MTDGLSHRIPQLDPAITAALVQGQFGDPFAVLGPHRGPDGRFVRVFMPGARSVVCCWANGASGSR